MNRFWKEYFIFMEKKTNTLKKALTGIILSVILIVIDQVTKLMAIHGLMNQQPFVIWDGVLPETYSRREKVPSDGRYLYPVFCRSIGQFY